MLLLLGALVAGVLTTLAPCVLPMLPVIVGGTISAIQYILLAGEEFALAFGRKRMPG